MNSSFAQIKWDKSHFYEIGQHAVRLIDLNPTEFHFIRQLLTANLGESHNCTALVLKNGIKLEAVNQWIWDHHISITDELNQSPIRFSRQWNSCAHTEGRSHGTLFLNPSICGQAIRTSELAWTIAHEVVHHFPIYGYPQYYQDRNEEFADVVAKTITLRLFRAGVGFCNHP